MQRQATAHMHTQTITNAEHVPDVITQASVFKQQQTQEIRKMLFTLKTKTKATSEHLKQQDFPLILLILLTQVEISMTAQLLLLQEKKPGCLIIMAHKASLGKQCMFRNIQWKYNLTKIVGPLLDTERVVTTAVFILDTTESIHKFKSF